MVTQEFLQKTTKFRFDVDQRQIFDNKNFYWFRYQFRSTPSLHSYCFAVEY